MLTVIILAAGSGSRLKTNTSKVLVDFAGKKLIRRVCEAVKPLNADQYIIVVPKEHLAIKENCPIENIEWVVQKHANGTADAVRSAMPSVKSDKILIVCADIPLVSAELLEKIIDTPKLGLITTFHPSPGSMGRIKRDPYNKVMEIIEAADANADELKINEVFSGIMLSEFELMKSFISNAKNNNKQAEYYLTDIVKFAKNYDIKTIQSNPWWLVQGVNDLSELIILERRFYKHIAQGFISSGLRITDPERFDCRGDLEFGINCTIDINTIIKGKVVIGDNCYIGPGVIIENSKIGNNVSIKANSYITDSNISDNANIGPFAHIRPNTNIGKDCKVGSFVEIKNSSIGYKSKIPHLSYIGDTTIGKSVNVGAGVITCNFDGFKKHRTDIADYCFIGAGVQLVAPISIGNNGVVGAGTCLRNNLNSNALAVNSNKILVKERWFKKELN